LHSSNVKTQICVTRPQYVNWGSVGARSCDLLYDIKTLLLEELKSTVRKYSAVVELKLEPTEEEPLHQDFLVEQEWWYEFMAWVMIIYNRKDNHI